MGSSQDQAERNDLQLKHLGFVRILAIHAVVLVSNLYDSAKQSSGSLKPTIDTVENAVTTVVAPVYEKIKGVPGELLVFLDKKVDEGIHKLDELAPPFAKTIVYNGQQLVKNAWEVAQVLADLVKVGGPLAAIGRAGEMSKNIVIGQLAAVWHKANQYPVLHGVTEMAVPTAAHWSEKYNSLVKDMAGKGFSLFNHVPLVPVEEMTKAYKQAEGSSVGEKGDTGSTTEKVQDKE